MLRDVLQQKVEQLKAEREDLEEKKIAAIQSIIDATLRTSKIV